MDRKLSFPIELKPEAINLIDKLMHPVPHLRLGCGPVGSLIDFTELKKHAFFKGYKFDKIINKNHCFISGSSSIIV
jgi:hypothetical protein